MGWDGTGINHIPSQILVIYTGSQIFSYHIAMNYPFLLGARSSHFTTAQQQATACFLSVFLREYHVFFGVGDWGWGGAGMGWFINVHVHMHTIFMLR